MIGTFVGSTLRGWCPLLQSNIEHALPWPLVFVKSFFVSLSSWYGFKLFMRSETESLHHIYDKSLLSKCCQVATLCKWPMAVSYSGFLINVWQVFCTYVSCTYYASTVFSYIRHLTLDMSLTTLRNSSFGSLCKNQLRKRFDNHCKFLFLNFFIRTWRSSTKCKRPEQQLKKHLSHVGWSCSW